MSWGGGIPELIPDELTNIGAGHGMELEKLGPRKWRFHGTPTSNWLVAGAPVHLEPGTYLFSGTASDPGGQNGGLMQIFRKSGSYVQINPVSKGPKTFEVAEAADDVIAMGLCNPGTKHSSVLGRISEARRSAVSSAYGYEWR